MKQGVRMGNKLLVLNKEVGWISINESDYICLTDIAGYKDSPRADDVIRNWLRNRGTLEFLGLWEEIYNVKFNPVEFDGIKNDSGTNSFSLTSKRWIEKTNAIGILSKPGRYGGTYAHKDIAFEFASWISPKFKLYLIKEFQRLKELEISKSNSNWDLKRNLAKINYDIHTTAIKDNLIPRKISKEQEKQIYANETDLLNVALFGMTNGSWKKRFGKKGNMRDYATGSQLVCLSNLESSNAMLIEEGKTQRERLIKLNEVAIYQMNILVDNKKIKGLLNPRLGSMRLGSKNEK